MPVFQALGLLLNLRLSLRENDKMGQLLRRAPDSLDPPLPFHPFMHSIFIESLLWIRQPGQLLVTSPKLRQPKLLHVLAVRAKGNDINEALYKLQSPKHTERIMTTTSTV